MTLAYRALLAPVAALDNLGNALPGRAFTIYGPNNASTTAPVYASDTGGIALTSAGRVADDKGNVSGCYVDLPGSYVIDFGSGYQAQTLAVQDTRDIAKPSDVATAVAALVAAAPGALDTLGELATALQNDEGQATSLAALVTAKEPKSVPAGIAATKQYLQRLAMYGAGPTLRRWRAALARQENVGNGTGSQAKLLCLGDSITLGAGLNSFTAAFPYLLRSLLGKDHGDAGSGMIHLLQTDSFNAAGSGGVDTRVNFVGTWATDTRGAFGAGARSATGTGNTVAFTDTGTDFYVYLVTGSDGGVVSIQVDGGTATTHDTSSGANGLLTVAKTGLTAGTHTILVTAPASGKAIVRGFESRNGQVNGVRVTKCGQSGAQSTSAIGNADGASSLPSIFDDAAPDLTVIMFRTNDYSNQMSIATYKSAMSTLIDRGQLTGDVLLVVPPATLDTTLTIPQSAYRQALYDLADLKGCALVDMDDDWGTYAQGNAAPRSLYSDAFHPSFRGYWALAKAIHAAIAPPTGSPRLGPSALLSTANTWAQQQTFANIVLGNSNSITIGDATLTRSSAFVLSTSSFFKATHVAANGASATNAALSARVAAGLRGLDIEAIGGAVVAGFGITGRPYTASTDRQTTVGAAGGASALPATPTTYLRFEDQNGNLLVVPAYAAT
jgi:lysophospholipase L1-like esterase